MSARDPSRDGDGVRSSQLWPFFAAFGVATAVAALVVVVAVSAIGEEVLASRPPGPMSILVVVAVDDGVRLVTEEANCRRPLFADVRARSDVVELRVIGQSPGGGCSASIIHECHEVRLPAPAAGKPLLAIPVAARAGGVSDKTLAREFAAGACPRPPLR